MESGGLFMSDSLKRFRRIEKATIVFCLIIFIMGIVEEIIAYLVSAD